MVRVEDKPVINLSSLPDNEVGKCLRFCLNTLSLSSEDTQKVLYDSYKTAQAINLLLAGGLLLSKDNDDTELPTFGDGL
jgi:hypothetical protein